MEVAASILGVISFGSKVANNTRVIYEGWRYASTDVEIIIRNAEDVVETLRDLRRLLRKSKVPTFEDDVNFEGVLHNCKDAFKELRRLMKPYRDIKRKGFLKAATLTAGWLLMGQKDYKIIGDRFESLKSTLILKLQITRFARDQDDANQATLLRLCEEVERLQRRVELTNDDNSSGIRNWLSSAATYAESACSGSVYSGSTYGESVSMFTTEKQPPRIGLQVMQTEGRTKQPPQAYVQSVADVEEESEEDSEEAEQGEDASSTSACSESGAQGQSSAGSSRPASSGPEIIQPPQPYVESIADLEEDSKAAKQDEYGSSASGCSDSEEEGQLSPGSSRPAGNGRGQSPHEAKSECDEDDYTSDDDETVEEPTTPATPYFAHRVEESPRFLGAESTPASPLAPAYPKPYPDLAKDCEAIGDKKNAHVVSVTSAPLQPEIELLPPVEDEPKIDLTTPPSPDAQVVNNEDDYESADEEIARLEASEAMPVAQPQPVASISSPFITIFDGSLIPTPFRHWSLKRSQIDNSIQRSAFPIQLAFPARSTSQKCTVPEPEPAVGEPEVELLPRQETTCDCHPHVKLNPALDDRTAGDHMFERYDISRTVIPKRYAKPSSFKVVYQIVAKYESASRGDATQLWLQECVEKIRPSENIYSTALKPLSVMEMKTELSAFIHKLKRQRRECTVNPNDTCVVVGVEKGTAKKDSTADKFEHPTQDNVTIVYLRGFGPPD